MQSNDIGDDRSTDGQGAGLIEHDRVHPARLLKMRAALDQNAPARAVADRGADRRRSGKADRTRAGDQQHGHRAPRVTGHDQGQCRQNERRRNKAAREILPHRLNRRPIVLGFLDPGDDPPDHGLAAHRGSAHHQLSAHHYRTCVHLCSRGNADRQVFPGDCRLIDNRLPVDHLAVDRYGHVVVHHHSIADLHGVDGNLDLGVVIEANPDGVLGTAQQLSDGTSRAAHRQIL